MKYLHFDINLININKHNLQWYMTCNDSHNYLNLHKCEWLQNNILNTENPQNGLGKLGLMMGNSAKNGIW